MAHPIVTDELAVLDQVATLLQEVPYVAPPSEADTVRELMRLRDEMHGAKEEDKAALMSQYDHLYHLLDQLRESRQAPEVDPDSPYFGHLRLEEDGKIRDLCIGKATRIQRGVRIVDWRNAPISRVFYRYQQGEEYSEEMGERTLEGVVLARRTVAIHAGRLDRIDAPEGTFVREGEGEDWVERARESRRLHGGQGETQKVYDAGQGGTRRLGTDLEGSRRRVDKRLPDIAGLIDPEQFDLITRPRSGFVVIRGTAGSGKTTVALHRIAWLAFADPAINSDRTLFLVFSPALRDYVAHVLPALGVPRARVRSFGEWADEHARRHFPTLPKQRRDDTPEVVVRLKLHPVMLVAMEDHQRRVRGEPTVEQAIDDWQSILVDYPGLRVLLHQHDPQAFTDEELAKAVNWSRQRFDELLRAQDGDKEAEAALDAEDLPLLLRAYQLRVGPLKLRGGGFVKYRHLAIDEVQDFSPLEVRVLIDCLDEHHSLTLAGDTQQHVMKEAGFTSWPDFFRHLGLDGAAVDTLRVAYRSSHEVVQFALGVLGDLREDDGQGIITTKHGPPVEVFGFTDHGACVAFLAEVLQELFRDEALASVVILTPSPAMSRLYYEGLMAGEVPRLRRVEEHNFTFAPGVEVTEVEKVKGLEFDYVVLVDVSAQSYPDSSNHRRVLHVGATRAVHQLWVCHAGTLSPIVREVIGGH